VRGKAQNSVSWRLPHLDQASRELVAGSVSPLFHMTATLGWRQYPSASVGWVYKSFAIVTMESQISFARCEVDIVSTALGERCGLAISSRQSAASALRIVVNDIEFKPQLTCDGTLSKLFAAL
jgi:hypothetical protein